MLRIFHLPQFGRSLRIVWLMEELGEAYEVERVDFPLTDAFKAIGGTGSVPAIVDGDIVMGESIAILQYLTGRRLQRSLELGLTVGPNPDPAAYAEHLQFLHLGEASLTMPAALLASTIRLAPEAERANFTAARCEQVLRDRLAVVERRLADGRPHLTGSAFTIADISVGFALHYADIRGLGAVLPDLARSYLARVRERPAFQRAVAV